MNLRFCTFTGADDTVNPEDLAAISKEYPQVEWGILIGSRTGHRFPSAKWIRSLNRLEGLNLSLHICGTQLDLVSSGLRLLGTAVGEGLPFQRCQLNFHGIKQSDIGGALAEAFSLMQPWSPEIIFQLDGVNDKLPYPLLLQGFRCAGLFDLSHGAGVLPDEWLNLPTGFPTGFAGGLGPENIAEELPKIAAVAREGWWIDMETKVFTGFQFDLGKCREVLKTVFPL
jgi:hypothetical protein